MPLLVRAPVALAAALLACAGCGEPDAADTGKAPLPEDTGTDTSAGPDTAPGDTAADTADTARDTAPADTAADTADTGAVEDPHPGEVDLDPEADAKLIGEGDENVVGADLSLSAAGDLDGDGFDDVVLGLPGAERGGSSSGGVYVAFGPVYGDLAVGDADVRLVGGSREEIGLAVASGGDLDGDGFADLVVGAPEVQPEGAVYVLYGPLAAGERAIGEAAGAVLLHEDVLTEGDNVTETGSAVVSDGDVDGDGLADLLIGASGHDWDRGAAYLVCGAPTGEVQLADGATATILGEEGGGHLGRSLALAGDTDGDGFGDVVVTDGGDDAMARLFRGPLAGDVAASDADAVVNAEARFSGGSARVAAAGDLDGDGHADLWLADPYDDRGGDSAGAAFLFRGPVAGVYTAADADAALLGIGADDGAGLGISRAGDVSGDGVEDVAVSAPELGWMGDSLGAVYLVIGPVLGTLSLADADVTLHGESDDWAGWPLASGDVDGDGRGDLLIGGPGDGDGGDGVGAAWVVYATTAW